MSRVRVVFHLSVEFGCFLFFQASGKAGGSEFSRVAECTAPAHWASRSGALAQSTPSRTHRGRLFLLSDVAGKASPAAGRGSAFQPSGMCLGKAQGEACSERVGVTKLLIRAKPTLYVV